MIFNMRLFIIMIMGLGNFLILNASEPDARCSSPDNMKIIVDPVDSTAHLSSGTRTLSPRLIEKYSSLQSLTNWSRGHSEFISQCCKLSSKERIAIFSYKASGGKGGNTLLHKIAHIEWPVPAVIEIINIVAGKRDRKIKGGRNPRNRVFNITNTYGETPLYEACSFSITSSTVIGVLLDIMEQTKQGREAINKDIHGELFTGCPRRNSPLSCACSHLKSDTVIRRLLQSRVEHNPKDTHFVEILARSGHKIGKLKPLFKEVVGQEVLEFKAIKFH